MSVYKNKQLLLNEQKYVVGFRENANTFITTCKCNCPFTLCSKLMCFRLQYLIIFVNNKDDFLNCWSETLIFYILKVMLKLDIDHTETMQFLYSKSALWILWNCDKSSLRLFHLYPCICKRLKKTNASLLKTLEFALLSKNLSSSLKCLSWFCIIQGCPKMMWLVNYRFLLVVKIKMKILSTQSYF